MFKISQNIPLHNTRHSAIWTVILTLVISIFSVATWASETLVSSQKQYKKVSKKAQAGDTIILKDGVWEDFSILFEGKGLPNKPITLRAQTKGKVILTGQSNLRIAGQYLVVSGLVFKDGYSPANEVISFRKNMNNMAYHSRVTEVVIDNFNKRQKFDGDYWVTLYGKYNRFDHNHLVGKKNKGVTLAVRLDSESSQENYHKIDHNYFGPRPVFGSNGGETLRIGTSKYSLTQSYVTVENNYFDRCNGEVEVISNKSGGNIFRNNVFFESRGTMTMRHGNGNLIENNVFFGNGKDHTGGIRVINAGQTVRNNYMSDLTGYRFGGALVVMNGSFNPPINRYHQVKEAVIEHNTIINSSHIQLAAGADEERDAPPVDSVMKNNLFYSSTPQNIFTSFDDISGIDFLENVLVNITQAPYKDGFTTSETSMEKAANGLLYPTDKALAKIGVSRSLMPVSVNEVGVSWYPKPGPEVIFDRNPLHSIKAGDKKLINKLSNGSSGDVFELSAGDYQFSTPITLDRAITIQAAPDAQNKVNITFTSSTLFELGEGGSLKLKGLNISGKKSKIEEGNLDKPGWHSVVRTKESLLGNYHLVLENCLVSDLNTSESFNFLAIHNFTIADNIWVKNSQFRDVSGHVFPLNKEIQDKGVYNAEYITVIDSVFENIGGEVMDVYRGGKDESTFGPHVKISGSTFKNVGISKNVGALKTKVPGTSLTLHGVQVTHILNNHFIGSGPININHTVGEPATQIINNIFEKTPQPTVKELVSTLKNTAQIKDNKIL